MVYNEKEYYPDFSVKFNTISKSVQSRDVVLKIFDLMNRQQYKSFDDFVLKNGTFESFVRNHSLGLSSVNQSRVGNVSLRHFMGSLTEEDFKLILNSISMLTQAKKGFDESNIKVTRVNETETNAVSYNGQNYSTNVLTDNNIHQTLENMQSNNKEFQATDGSKNAENMFKKLSKDVMETLNFKHLYEVVTSELNEEEQKVFDAAIDYQEKTNEPIRVDLSKGYIIDSNNNIHKIVDVNGKSRVISGKDNISDTKSTAYQKVLTAPNS